MRARGARRGAPSLRLEVASNSDCAEAVGARNFEFLPQIVPRAFKNLPTASCSTIISPQCVSLLSTLAPSGALSAPIFVGLPFSLQTRARRSQASAYTRSALEGGHSGGDRSFVRRANRTKLRPELGPRSLRIAAYDIWATWPVSYQYHRGVSKVLMNRIELDH